MQFRSSGDERQHLDRALGIDLVCRVRRPVIVRVQAGEEKQCRNPLPIEGNMVAAFMSSIGECKVQTDFLVRFRRSTLEIPETVPVPITLSGRLESRPIMSMLIMAVIEGRGTVGSIHEMA